MEKQLNIGQIYATYFYTYIYIYIYIYIYMILSSYDYYMQYCFVKHYPDNFILIYRAWYSVWLLSLFCYNYMGPTNINKFVFVCIYIYFLAYMSLFVFCVLSDDLYSIMCFTLYITCITTWIL